MVAHATLRRTSAAAAVGALGALALLLPTSTFAQLNFGINDAYSVAEDTALVVPAPGVLANDQGAGVTAEQPSDPPNGTVVAFAANGSFTYQPNPNFSGTDSFTYRARVGAFTDLATVTITVTAVNDPPIAMPNSYTVAEDGTLTTNATNGVRTNDDDVETPTNSLTIQLVPGGGTTNGTLALNANGSFTYTPSPNFSGTDTFSYRAVDNGAPPLQSAPATVTITVTPVNDPPVATANTYATNEDTPLGVPAPGVLADDTDPEQGTLTAQLVTGVAANTGTLVLNPNGSFTYTPAPGFFGTASFTYRAVDNGAPPAQSAPATVTITIAGVNDPPIATNDTYAANEDAALTVNAAAGVLANDTDPDVGNLLTAQLVTGLAANTGTLVLNPNGSFTYTPSPGFSGAASFTYRAVDNGTPPGQSGVATVTITVAAVNDAPVAVPDSYSTQEDAPPLTVAAPGVLANDTDEEKNVLTARLLTAPAAASGTLTLNPNGSFTFTPRANFSGTATFTYAAVDNGTPPAQSAAATVTITVAAVNDPPVAVPDTYNATEDTTLSVPATTGVLANDTDIDSPKSGWTASLVGNVTKGTLALSANGSFNYTPGPEYSGPDSFTYRVSDGAAPPGQSQPVTVTITVAAVNDPPKPVTPGPGPAVPDQTASEALPFTLNLAPFFVDPEADPISFPTVANLPPGLAATPAGLISGTPTLQSVRECDNGVVDLTVSDGKGQLPTKFCLRVLKAGRTDLALSVSAAPTPAVLNQSVVWTFLIENKSLQPVGNVSLSAVLAGAIPFNLAPVPAPGCMATPQGNQTALGCTGGPVPGNGAITIAVTGASALPGDILTTASIAITDPTPIDESPANNSASASLSIAERVAAGPAQKLVAPDSRAAAAGDLNGDGFLDLALVSSAGQSTQIYPNVVDPADPGGRKRAFAVQPVSLGDRGLGGGVAMGDFDADGALDLVVANRTGEPNRIFRNPNNGSLAMSVLPDALGTAGGSSNAVAVGDLNGDSLTDIVFANSSPNPVFTNQGGGRFLQTAALGNADSRDIAVANLLGDAQPELVFANADGDAVVYTFNNAMRRYDSTTLPTGPTTSVAAGDFDADGRTDLVFARLGAAGGTPSSRVFRNTQVAAGSQFVPGAELGGAPTNDVLAVDTNADGALDIVAISATGGHRIFVNDRTGQFTLHPEQFVSAGALSSLAAKLGADDRIDVAVAGSSGLEVFYNDGRGNLGRGDTGSPVIQLQGQPSVQVVVEEPYTDAGATATDDIDGVLTSKITVTNPVNTAILGTYTVTYAVVDSSGNAAIPLTRTVTVAARTGTGGGGGGTFGLTLMALVAALWLVKTLRRTRVTE